MCQFHSVAGTETLTLFHVFGVEYPSERAGGGLGFDGRLGEGEGGRSRRGRLQVGGKAKKTLVLCLVCDGVQVALLPKTSASVSHLLLLFQTEAQS